MTNFVSPFEDQVSLGMQYCVLDYITALTRTHILNKLRRSCLLTETKITGPYAELASYGISLRGLWRSPVAIDQQTKVRVFDIVKFSHTRYHVLGCGLILLVLEDWH